jgi:hypothetical protein
MEALFAGLLCDRSLYNADKQEQVIQFAKEANVSIERVFAAAFLALEASPTEADVLSSLLAIPGLGVMAKTVTRQYVLEQLVKTAPSAATDQNALGSDIKAIRYVHERSMQMTASLGDHRDIMLVSCASCYQVRRLKPCSGRWTGTWKLAMPCWDEIF